MITFIVCLLAGLGAGLGTGFAGMSAAAVISPMLIAFYIWTPTRQSVSHLPAMSSRAQFPLIPMEKIRIWILKTDL